MKNQVNLGLLGSDSTAIGGKRSSDELGMKHESVRKRIKMQDHHSVSRSEETGTYHCKNREASHQFQLGGEISQVTSVPVTFDLDASQVARNERAVLSVETDRPLDLNTDECAADSSSNGSPERAETCDVSLLNNFDKQYDGKCVMSGRIGLDLNVEDVTSSVQQDSFYSSTNHDHLESRGDAYECGTTTNPAKEKDPLRVWKEMKQNGFLSSSHGDISLQSGLISSAHGGIPMLKQHGRKSKSDVLLKKMELAKKEQVDRFTKIAAPSGLLNGLNPGIINHVRNKKQVHSIIEALVRSEKLEHDDETRQESHPKTEAKETCRNSDSGMHQFSYSQGCVVSAMVCRSKQIGGYPILSRGSNFCTVDCISGKSSVSHSPSVIEGDALALKLLASTKEDFSTYSNDESTNVSCISSLSVRAASVASQWLELLHQDTKGRLSALRRSKKRVQAVITAELPFLITKEFPSNQENDPCLMKNLPDGLVNDVISFMHRTRWSTLFDQMDKALSEEEKQLESWLNKVKDMQLHCDQGLHNIHWNTILGFQHQESMDNSTRIGKADSSERELAVRAAAASIYSTCSFLMSKENVSCF